MKAADRVSALTRQLLAFGRRQTAMPETLDMNEVIRDIGQLVRVTVTKGIQVDFELPDALGKIYADRSDIEQVVVNLAMNAREAMPQGGGIVIRASNVDLDRQFSTEHPSVPPGRYVCLTVTDTGGAGEERRHQGRAFQRFQRQSSGGEGLGLAALFNLVNRNGGSVLAVSELGRGSTFRVYFPRTDGESATSQEPAKPSGGSETVLLVEADDSVRALA
jgi:signal transduction histidine kinase